MTSSFRFTRRARSLLLPLLLGCFPALTRGVVVLESNQASASGSLRSGGTAIAAGSIKVLPFISGTSALQLTAVDVALVAASAGSYQVEFRIYAANSLTGEPVTTTPGVAPTPLYTAAFTPTLTTTSAWYSLSLNYTLNASTTYAFGFAVPGANAITFQETNLVKWVNTAEPSLWPPVASSGYAGVGTNRLTDAFLWYGFDGNGTYLSAWEWKTASTDNAFRLYAAPEPASKLPFFLGLGAVGALQWRRRARQTSRGPA